MVAVGGGKSRGLFKGVGDGIISKLDNYDNYHDYDNNGDTNYDHDYDNKNNSSPLEEGKVPGAFSRGLRIFALLASRTHPSAESVY